MRRLTGEHAPAERQSIAATAVTVLVDALWISLRPGNNIRRQPGLTGLTSTAGLTISPWRATGRRWPRAHGRARP